MVVLTCCVIIVTVGAPYHPGGASRWSHCIYRYGRLYSRRATHNTNYNNTTSTADANVLPFTSFHLLLFFISLVQFLTSNVFIIIQLYVRVNVFREVLG